MPSAHPQLLDYIQRQREKGLGDDLLRTALLNRGWQSSVVENAFTELATSSVETRDLASLPKPTDTTASSPESPTSPSFTSVLSSAKQSPPFPFGLVIIALIFALIIGTAIGLYLYRGQLPSLSHLSLPLFSLTQIFTTPTTSIPSPTSDARQHIAAVINQVLGHINKGEYLETLDYFTYEHLTHSSQPDTLILMAITKAAYQDQGQWQPHYDPQQFTITNDSVTATINFTVNQQPRTLKYDLRRHADKWKITATHLDPSLDLNSLASSPDVINDAFSHVTLANQPLIYPLLGGDTLTIDRTLLDPNQPTINFNFPTPPQTTYQLSIYESPNLRTNQNAITNQPFTYQYRLTNRSYGVVTVYGDAGLLNDPTRGQPGEIILLATIPFRVSQ